MTQRNSKAPGAMDNARADANARDKIDGRAAARPVALAEEGAFERSVQARRITRKRMVLLALSTLVLLFLGLIYAFSMFAKPMIEDFGISGAGFAFNVMMMTFCAGAVVGSFIDKSFGVRASLIVCAVLFGAGFLGTGAFGSQGLWAVYVFYAVIGGFGVGIGYNTIVATTNVWFPDAVGTSSGVMMMGFGISSLLFGNVALALRPALGGMGPTLTVLGVVVVVLTVVLAFTLKRPPANIVEVMAPEKVASSAGAELGENDNIFKTKIFYIYYVWGIIVIALGLAVIGNCAADATALGVDPGFAVLLVGLVSTCNGLSRLVIGALYDRTNIVVTMLADGLVGLAGVGAIVAAFMTGASALYIVGALCCGFAYGGVPVVASAFARQRFGAARYPFNLSVVNFAILFASLVNIVVMSAMGPGNRLGVFLVVLVLSAVALVDVLFFARAWKKDMQQAA